MGLAAVLKQQFVDGTPADVLLLTSPLVEDLGKQGKVAAVSKVDVARSGGRSRRAPRDPTSARRRP